MSATTTIVAPGTCLVHGAYAGTCCPACSTWVEPYVVIQPPVRFAPIPPLPVRSRERALVGCP